MINCREEEISQHQRRSLDELSSITVSYDWKDVSQLMKVTLDSSDTTVEIPPSVLALTNMELKDRLISLGEKPGPISDTTRRVYQKHLVKIESACVDNKNKVYIKIYLKISNAHKITVESLEFGLKSIEKLLFSRSLTQTVFPRKGSKFWRHISRKFFPSFL